MTSAPPDDVGAHRSAAQKHEPNVAPVAQRPAADLAPADPAGAANTAEAAHAIGDPVRVLFLCTANSARSQIAEALLTREGGGRFIVASAGTAPAARVHPGAVAALAALGIDWSGARPKGLDAVAELSWDLVITTCDNMREACPMFRGRPVHAHWGVPDPVASDRRADAFDDTVQLLAWRIDLMLTLRPEGLGRAALAHRAVGIGRATPGAAAAPPSL